MTLSSGEIRTLKFAKRMRGYDPAAVDRALNEVGGAHEAIERERDALGKRVGELEEQVSRSEGLERTLQNTLVLAQRFADELKEQARQQAAATVEDAESQARRILVDGEREATARRAEIARLEERERETRARFTGFLRDTLAKLEAEEHVPEGTSAPGALVEDLTRSIGS